MEKMSIKKASLIYGCAKYSTIILNMLLTAILSRLLTPNDYGIVAIITVFTSLFSVLSNLGIGPAVIYHKEIKQEQLQEIFNFSIRISLILTGIFALLSYPISVIYKDNVYIALTLLLSVSVFFNAANMVPNAVLLRDKRFIVVGIRMIISTILSGVIAVIAAFLGAKYYTLVLQSILSAAITFFWNLKGSRLRLGLKCNKSSVNIVKQYSLEQFGFNICIYIVQNIDNMLIGARMGNEALGFYNKGYTLSRYPVNNIGYVITPVLQPILTDYRENKEYIYKKFVDLFKAISLIGVFLSVVCIWAGRELILCFFGNQWEQAVVPFQIMSFGMWSQLVNTLFGSIYQSIGCTRQMLRSGILFTACSVLAVIVGVLSNSIACVAVLMTICTYIKFFSEVFFLIKMSMGFSVLRFLAKLIPDLALAVVLFSVAVCVGPLTMDNLFLGAAIKTFILGLVFLLFLVLSKQYKYLLIILPKKFRKS